MLVIKESQSDAVEKACKFLHLGKAISFATDTVYGIAVDASNFKAVEDLYKIKKRDTKKPIAIFLKDLRLAKEIFYFDDVAQKIAEKFLPGKLTLVLKTKAESVKKLAKNLNQNSDEFLGFRIVENNFIQVLLKKFDGILAVTSANLSGDKPANSSQEVKKYFAKSSLVALLIEGENSDLKNSEASTVVKIFNQKIDILRRGAIKESTILNFHESF